MSGGRDRRASTVGNYNFGAVIGKGGVGTVYSGLDVENGDFVAIKQINLQHIPKLHLTEIMQEIDLLKNLKHPNIVKYIKYEKTDDFLCIVLEYVENGSLSSIVKKFGKFPEPLVCVYITQVLEGLAYLHDQGVVHRDIKGANILTTKEGVIKLADFGLATKNTNDVNAVVGTPYWIAPEVIEMQGATSASDIWSVGCTVIELLTGEPPYYEFNNMSALYHIVQDDYPPLPEGISPALKEWLMECFQKDPVLRITAHKLLKHRWIQSGKRKEITSPLLTDPINVTKKIQDYNTKLRTQANRIRAYPAKLKQQQPQQQQPATLTRMLPPPELVSDEWGDDFSFSQGDSVLSNSKDGENSGGASYTLGAKGREESLLSLKGLLRNSVIDVDMLGVRPESPPPTVSVIEKKKPMPPGWKNLNLSAVTPEKNPSIGALPKWASENDIKNQNNNGNGIDLASRLHKKFRKEQYQIPTKSSPRSPRSQDDDIFGEFENQLDVEFDIDAHVVKDQLTKMSGKISKLMTKLVPHQTEEVILTTCQELVTLFRDNPNFKRELLRRQGVIPIMEMLEVSNPRVIHSILQVVNQIIEDNEEIHENLCLVGGIPCIMKFSGSEHSLPIRLECARFISTMCSTSILTLQMVIACRGLPVLVDMLSTNYEESKILVWMAIDAILSVFELQTTTPKKDFCRIFARSGLLKIMANALKNSTEDEEAKGYIEKIANILLLFSSADDGVVKLAMAQEEVITVVFSTFDNLPPMILVQLLKCIKQLVTDHVTRAPIQRAGAIRHLINVLATPHDEYVNRMQIYVLGSLHHLCHLDYDAQTQAVEEGVIPHLQDIIKQHKHHTNPFKQEQGNPLKQQALPLLFDLAHVPKTHEQLWKHNGVEFYLDLLCEEYWEGAAMDSLSVWMEADTKSVEEIIAQPTHTPKIVDAFKNAKNASFVKFVEAVVRALITSSLLARALSTSSQFVRTLVERLQHPICQVRVNLLKILRSLHEQHPNPQKMVDEHKLIAIVKKLVQDKVLVKNLATRLLLAMGEPTSPGGVTRSAHNRRASLTGGRKN